MFSLPNNVRVSSDLEISSELVVQTLFGILTPERQQKIEKVLQERCFDCCVVLENIYDRGNASAVMRSQEAFGFAQTHIIEMGEKFKESQRTTAGADKWLEVTKWKNTTDCVKQLKQQGYKIAVTYLDASSKPIEQVDFSKPTALVMGNEKEGISKDMLQLADEKVILPMVGFVQSYNISVAAALCFYQMYLDRVKRLGRSGDLNEQQKMILKAQYTLRTLDSGIDILKQKFGDHIQ